MNLSKDIDSFCQGLGLSFNTPALLLEALTHPSYGTKGRADNQRLEFLGDRVLGLVIAQALHESDETAAEGEMAPRFNALVRKETCAQVAEEIGLGAIMRIGRSEIQSGGRHKSTVLGDGLEALIAAIYLDQGFTKAQQFILHCWGDRIINTPADARDAKTILQEWAQGRKMPPPEYILRARSGPDHAPIFEIEVRLQSGQSAIAHANSKRAAQQQAAIALLGRLEQ